jgi:phosphate transport system permease protein
MRQAVKPVIEVLAAIPSVAYGFFAILVLAPLLQNQGGLFLAVVFWAIGLPVGLLLVAIFSAMLNQALPKHLRGLSKVGAPILFGLITLFLLYLGGSALYGVRIASGANAFNVSLILAVMVLPTIVSVSEDALQAVGREMREGSYALGSTRAETILKVILPAASSGVLAAVILGAMRAVGETMVVLMAAGNAANIPEPFYSVFAPIKTLTATIAGEMGEAPRGTPAYYVLFLMGMCLLVFSLVCNLISEWVLRRQRALLKGA